MVLLGKDILILNGSGRAVMWAAKSCNINVQAETIEVSSPSSGSWRQFIVGRKEWSVDISHLVTAIANVLPMVGDTLTIHMKVDPDVAIPFDGFVNNVTIVEQSIIDPAKIYWDTTRKRFVAYKSLKYYSNWPTRNEYAGNGCYNYNDEVYTIYNGDLVINRMTGSAIVTNAKLTASVGNLAQGSLQLKGNGPLEIVTS